MIHYTLSIDSAFIIHGTWDLNSLNESYVTFGDGVQGFNLGSIVEWDYVRYGVVPEPCTYAMILFGMYLLALRMRDDR